VTGDPFVFYLIVILSVSKGTERFFMEKYGFVYIWRDRKHKRYYIGSHWGFETDKYICSSRWMRKAYRRRPDDFKRRILARIWTTRADLYLEEERWIGMIKSEEIRVRYYNLNLGFTTHWTATDRALSIGAKISRGLKGLVVYTDGVTERKFRETDVIPKGFFQGGLKWDEERRKARTGEGNPMFGKTGEANPLFGTHRTESQVAHQSEVMKEKYASGELVCWNKWVPPSEISRERNRQAHLGISLTEEHIASIREAHSRPETREKNAAAHRHPLTEEHRASIKEAHSRPETREKNAAAHRGKVQSLETIAKKVAATTGKKRSDEIRQKMSLAAQEREAKKREKVAQT